MSFFIAVTKLLSTALLCYIHYTTIIRNLLCYLFFDLICHLRSAQWHLYGWIPLFSIRIMIQIPAGIDVFRRIQVVLESLKTDFIKSLYFCKHVKKYKESLLIKNNVTFGVPVSTCILKCWFICCVL